MTVPGLPPKPRSLHLLKSLVKEEEEKEASQVVTPPSEAPKRGFVPEFYDSDKQQIYRESTTNASFIEYKMKDSKLGSQVVRANPSAGFKGKILKKSRSRSNSSDRMKQKTKHTNRPFSADNNNKSNHLNNHMKNGYSMISAKAQRPSSTKSQKSSSAKSQRPVSPHSYSSDTYSSDNEYIKKEKHCCDTLFPESCNDKDKKRNERRDSKSESSSDSYISNDDDTGKGKEKNGHGSTRKGRAFDNGIQRKLSNLENSDNVIHDGHSASSSSSFSSSDEEDKSIPCGTATSKPPKQTTKAKPLLFRKKHQKYQIYQKDPDLYLEGKLQQKYSELEELMTCSIVDQQSHVMRQHLYQVELLHEQYRNTSHGFFTTNIIIPRSLPADVRNKSQQPSKRPFTMNSEVDQDSSDNVYGTMHRVENTERTGKIRTDVHAHEPSGGKQKPQKMKKIDATLKQTISNSEEETSEIPSVSSKSSTKSKASSPSHSPQCKVQVIDDHIKYSNNEALKQWLKEKDKLYRQHLREEKRKKRLDREILIIEANEKFEKRLESEKMVKEWMKEKNKELLRQHKEDKRQMKDITEREMKRKSHSLPGDALQVMPKSAPSKRSNDIKIDKHLLKSDETPDFVRDQMIYKKREIEEENKQAKIAHDGAPHPPQTKFIYKRPVAGKIKLKMEVRGKSPTIAKSKEEIKDDKSTAESNKYKQMRLSYDEWITRKREDDAVKKKSAARQRELAKSDPELDRIIPALGKKRIEDKLNARKRIDTGIKKFDDKANQSFGGADFGGEKEGNLPEQPKCSYRLEREKETGSLLTLKQIQRPSSAPAARGNVPHPKKSTKSPRQAVIPQRVDKIIASDKTENPYQLPFPPEQGIPAYVAERQRRIFADAVTGNLDETEQRNFLNAKLVKEGLGDTDEAHKNNPGLEEIKIEPSDAKYEVYNLTKEPEHSKITDIMYSPRQHNSTDSSSDESQQSDNCNDIPQANVNNAGENSDHANFGKKGNTIDIEDTKYDIKETVDVKAHSHYETYENLNKLTLESQIVVNRNEDKISSNIEHLKEKVASLKVDTITSASPHNGTISGDTDDTFEDEEQITETVTIEVITETDPDLVGILKDSKRNGMNSVPEHSGEPSMSESKKTAEKFDIDQTMLPSDELSNSRKKVSFNEQTEVFKSFESSSTDTVMLDQNEFDTEAESLDAQQYFMDDEAEGNDFNGKFGVNGDKLTINIGDMELNPIVITTEKADKVDIEDINGNDVPAEEVSSFSTSESASDHSGL